MASCFVELLAHSNHSRNIFPNCRKKLPHRIRFRVILLYKKRLLSLITGVSNVNRLKNSGDQNLEFVCLVFKLKCACLLHPRCHSLLRNQIIYLNNMIGVLQINITVHPLLIACITDSIIFLGQKILPKQILKYQKY